MDILTYENAERDILEKINKNIYSHISYESDNMFLFIDELSEIIEINNFKIKPEHNFSSLYRVLNKDEKIENISVEYFSDNNDIKLIKDFGKTKLVLCCSERSKQEECNAYQTDLLGDFIIFSVRTNDNLCIGLILYSEKNNILLIHADGFIKDELEYLIKMVEVPIENIYFQGMMNSLFYYGYEDDTKKGKFYSIDKLPECFSYYNVNNFQKWVVTDNKIILSNKNIIPRFHNVTMLNMFGFFNFDNSKENKTHLFLLEMPPMTKIMGNIFISTEMINMVLERPFFSGNVIIIDTENCVFKYKCLYFDGNTLGDPSKKCNLIFSNLKELTNIDGECYVYGDLKIEDCPLLKEISTNFYIEGNIIIDNMSFNLLEEANLYLKHK